ncbi:hypothetical protein [Fluviicola taffensis]|uniref:hypothetical protein n=1 Tax=Fluviicola taffensis TaxID=191579 RepID=UPI00313797EB
MDHLEFFPYHNRLIEFIYLGKRKKGVVLDAIPYSEKRVGTEYAFIPVGNLITWRDASEAEKKQLQETIDIKNISKAELSGLQHA